MYTIAFPRLLAAATVYTNAPIRRRETLATNLCTLLRPCGRHGSATVYTNGSNRLRDALATNLCTLLRSHGCWPSQQCTQMPQTGAERPSRPICVHSCGPRSHIMYGFLPEQASHGCSPRCGAGQLVSLGERNNPDERALCVGVPWHCTSPLPVPLEVFAMESRSRFA